MEQEQDRRGSHGPARRTFASRDSSSASARSMPIIWIPASLDRIQLAHFHLKRRYTAVLRVLYDEQDKRVTRLPIMLDNMHHSFGRPPIHPPTDQTVTAPNAPAKANRCPVSQATGCEIMRKRLRVCMRQKWPTRQIGSTAGGCLQPEP